MAGPAVVGSYHLRGRWRRWAAGGEHRQPGGAGGGGVLRHAGGCLGCRRSRKLRLCGGPGSRAAGREHRQPGGAGGGGVLRHAGKRPPALPLPGITPTWRTDLTGLQVVNIANPAAPAAVGFYDTPGDAYDVAVAGDYAYVADGTAGLRVVNIANPAKPV